jgi:hypothetical protein
MWRLAIVGALLAVAVGPGMAAGQEGCPAEASSPEETASILFAEYLAGGAWDSAYEVLHPEAQLRILRPAFAAMHQTRAVVGPLLDVEVFPARVSPGWTWGVTGLRFTNVAEVPVRFVRGVGFGIAPTIEMVPLVLLNGCWRWLPPPV